MIRLRTLGGLGLDGEGAPLLQRRPLALLAVLAAAGELGISRDKLLAYFWPESDEDRGRNVLRQLLHSIRRDVREPELFVGTTELRLNRELLASDFAEFDRACDVGDWEVAVALYRGPFLDGFYVSNAAGFENWKESERARLARRFSDAAEQVARRAAGAGDHAKAIGMWQRLAVVEPLNSRIAIELMRAMAAAGDVGGALSHARVHETLLREELGTSPDVSFSKALDQLRSSSEPREKRGAFACDEQALQMSSLGERGVPNEVGDDYAGYPNVGLATAPNRLAFSAGTVAKGVALVTLLVGASAAVMVARRDVGAALDSSVYVVAPLREDGALSISNETRVAGRLVHEALSRWQGVSVVDRLQVEAALPAEAGILEAADAFRLTRKFGARHLIWGSVWATNDTAHIGLTLYDVARQAPVRELTLNLPRDASAWGPALSSASRILLLGDQLDLRPANEAEPTTTVVTSWRSYVRGHAALRQWDVTRARNEFRTSVSADQEFASAQLWLAQVDTWLGDDRTGEQQRAAQNAAKADTKLAPTDLLRARGLAALSRGMFSDACGYFDKIVAVDSLDFAAWFGLGECHARDSVVVPDLSSQSGWQFRGSYNTAITAYARALELAPGFLHSFEGRGYSRLSQLLFVDAWRSRSGIGATPNGPVVFAGFPEWRADSIAFIPYPVETFRTQSRLDLAAARGQAIRRNRALLRTIVTRWVSVDTSSDALEAYALALESTGELTGPRGRGPSAIDAIQRARLMARRDSVAQQTRLAVAELRFLFKLTDYTRVKRLADSLLNRPTGGAAAVPLAGIAALTGRIAFAADVMASAAPVYMPSTTRGHATPAPLPVIVAGLRLACFSAFAGPRDSLSAAGTTLDRLINAQVEPDRQADVREALLRIPARLASDQLSTVVLPESVREDAFVRMRAAIANKQPSYVHETLVRIERGRPGLSAADVSADELYQEAVMALAVGDSISSIRRLDQLLEGLPTASSLIVGNPFQAAAVVRAMVLRATLAEAVGDSNLARRWAAAVATLWADADPFLSPQVTAMQKLTSEVTRPH